MELTPIIDDLYSVANIEIWMSTTLILTFKTKDAVVYLS